LSESLTDDELAELVRHGRINTSKSTVKRHQTKTKPDVNKKEHHGFIESRKDTSSKLLESPKSSDPNDLNPRWLEAQKERAERNIASSRQDRQRREDMREASKF
jgi:hypothetical protein